MDCYLTQTAAWLPGDAVENDQIDRYLGTIASEELVRDTVLAMNGIKRRHYAQNEHQEATEDIYSMATRAAELCLRKSPDIRISYLTAGTTFAPLTAPGIASIIHDRLSERGHLKHSIEISSHSGICSSSATALVSAIRAVRAGEHAAVLSIGAEHPSDKLKSTVLHPPDDRDEHENIQHSQWFMSVFLRFMLSDGAGAFLLQNHPAPDRLSLKVNWTYAASFAHAAPLCMKYDTDTGLLSQDITILNRHLFPCAEQFVSTALEKHDESLDSYHWILPHISSYFFRKKMERLIVRHCGEGDNHPSWWTNLATAGNTGAASIYILLDEFLRTHDLKSADRLMLFVPESGQFNFVMISLTVVHP